MKQGIILIGIKDQAEFTKLAEERKAWEAEQLWLPENRRRSFIPNPYRTGEWVVVTDELIRRLVSNPETAEQIIKHRWTFLCSDLAQWIIAEGQAANSG